jgi:hypothetical protein
VTLRGNDMESEMYEWMPLNVKLLSAEKDLKEVLVVAKGFQEVRVHVKSDVPARDRRTSQVYVYNVRWTRNLSLMSLIEAVNNDVYQKQKYNDSCKIKFFKA